MDNLTAQVYLVIRSYRMPLLILRGSYVIVITSNDKRTNVPRSMILKEKDDSVCKRKKKRDFFRPHDYRVRAKNFNNGKNFMIEEFYNRMSSFISCNLHMCVTQSAT